MTIVNSNLSLPALEKLFEDYPLLAECKEDIQKAFYLLRETIINGGRIYVCGNGGSAADSQHIVGEMMKGFLKKRPVTFTPEVKEKLTPETAQILSGKLQGALPCHSLMSESALITALINDISADIVFAQQIYGYGRKGDCLIGISTSGNAVNVCLAIELAAAMGLHTVALTGSSGGNLVKKQLCNAVIRVPSESTPKIQEYHLPIYHALCAALEDAFFAG
jgi:D-sedoheptulose 7-phosphate isomerase